MKKCNTWWQKILSIYCVVGLLWVLYRVIYRFSQQQFYAGLSSLRTLFIVSGYTIYNCIGAKNTSMVFFRFSNYSLLCVHQVFITAFI